MGSASIKTVPSKVDIPGDLGSFNGKEQIVWTGSSWHEYGTFTPTHGFQGEFKHDPSHGLTRQAKNMYSPNQGDGAKWSGTAGNQHSHNSELKGNGRWMSASNFNGIGFEIYQSSRYKHAQFLKYICLVFANRDSNTQWRTYGINLGYNAPSAGKKYIVWNRSDGISDINNWGSAWQLQGFIIHVYNDGGANKDESDLEIFNLRFGHKFGNGGTDHRHLIAGKRSYDNRKVKYGNVHFTNPYR